jgi:hypothetical protein
MSGRIAYSRVRCLQNRFSAVGLKIEQDSSGRPAFATLSRSDAEPELNQRAHNSLAKIDELLHSPVQGSTTLGGMDKPDSCRRFVRVKTCSSDAG